MRHQGFDEIDRDETEEVGLPLDAAESTWDPWLWALYLRALAEKHPPTLH